MLALNGGATLLPDAARAGRAGDPAEPSEHSSIVTVNLEERLRQAETTHRPREFWNRFDAHETIARMPTDAGPRLRALLAETAANELSSFWGAVKSQPAIARWIGVEALRDAARRAGNGADVLRALSEMSGKDTDAASVLVDAWDSETIDHILQTSDRWNISLFWDVIKIPGFSSKVTRAQVGLALERTQRNFGTDMRILAGLREDKYSTWSRHVSQDDLLRYLDRGLLEIHVQEEFVHCLYDTSLEQLWQNAQREYLAGLYAPVVKARSIEKGYEDGGAKLPQGAGDALRGMITWRKRIFDDPKKVLGNDVYLQLVRVINHAHVFSSVDRANLVAGMSAGQLYTLTTLGESELYVLGTSAFRDQIAPALLRAVRDQWHGDFKAFLQEEDPYAENLAQFLRVAATFAKSDEFFGKDSSDLPYLLRPVLERIDASEGGLHVATVLLDLLMPGSGSSRGVLPNPFTRTVEDLLADEYMKSEGEQRLVLGTIGALYAQFAPHDERFAQMKDAYGSDVKIESLSLEELFTRDEKGRLVHTARMYFFPGADGEASYTNFKQQFKSWDCAERGGYTECVRHVGNRTVRILMNDPRADLKTANAVLDSMLEGKRVQTLIMRGHSSSVEQFIEAVRGKDYKPVVVHMGACGAFSHLSRIYHVFKKFVHVISTKGTGTMAVNDPMLSDFFVDILSLPLTKESPFRWDQFAKNMNARFRKSDQNVRSNFEAYQLPHRNYAAMLLHRVSLAMQSSSEDSRAGQEPANR